MGALVTGVQTWALPISRAVVGVEAVLAAVFAHVLARHEVGVEVAAAESVDRLLGIADQAKQRRLRFATLRACGAGLVQAAEDRPLLRIGVLELVDQRHRPARGDRGGETRAGRRRVHAIRSEETTPELQSL